jgi:hypothetical protein
MLVVMVHDACLVITPTKTLHQGCCSGHLNQQLGLWLSPYSASTCPHPSSLFAGVCPTPAANERHPAQRNMCGLQQLVRKAPHGAPYWQRVCDC